MILMVSNCIEEKKVNLMKEPYHMFQLSLRFLSYSKFASLAGSSFIRILLCHCLTPRKLVVVPYTSCKHGVTRTSNKLK